MNQPNKLRSCFALATLLAVACMLTGCIYPHTSPRSVEVCGRVLDATTHLPIKGVKVCFCNPPYHTVYTDADGYFRMKAAKNFHWIVGADGSGLPGRKSNEVCISHNGYVTRGFLERYDGDPLNIVLKPKP